MTNQLDRTLQLLDSGKGERAISTALGITRHRARALVLEVTAGRPSTALILAPNGASLPTLSFYDTARQALAQAKTLAEVSGIADKASAIRELHRRAKDRTLQMDAQEIVWRAERRIGEMVIEIKKNDGLDKGSIRRGAKLEPRDKGGTLEDIGIDKKLSARAQKLASISDRAIDARIASHRTAMESGARVTGDLLRPGPARSMNRAEAADSLDPFFTPPWATRALCELVLPRLGQGLSPDPKLAVFEKSIWEPACGEGHMAEILKEYFGFVTATDIHDYGYGLPDYDFLHRAPDPPAEACDWIITNPPFRGGMAERFVLRALELAHEGVAMFVALQFLESVGRYERIFRDRPPTMVAVFSERVNCCKGRWDPDGSTDAAYCWLVWIKGKTPLPLFWIPPGQRKALTKPDDRARFAAWSMPGETEGAE